MTHGNCAFRELNIMSKLVDIKERLLSTLRIQPVMVSGFCRIFEAVMIRRKEMKELYILEVVL